jgi:membrane protease YdiL (CAAX protease family)
MKKTETLKILLVPFVIYLLLFFPISAAIDLSLKNFRHETSTVEFSIINELLRLGFYSIPSFLLILFLVYRLSGFNKAALSALFFKQNKNGKFLTNFLKDCGLAAIVFLGIFLICFLVDIIKNFFSSAAAVEIAAFDLGTLSVIVLLFSCIGTGFLEEIFFRLFLPFSLKLAGIPTALQIFLSSALFGLCHLWEGAFGILSAFLCGLFLCFVFLRHKSLIVISLGHAAYNFLVWLALL